MVKLNITNWAPTHHPTGVVAGADGSVSQTREEDHGVVAVFTYAGGLHGPPFTTLETYFCGRRYECRLPQAYHPRWFGRLASQFDWECWREAKSRGAT